MSAKHPQRVSHMLRPPTSCVRAAAVVPAKRRPRAVLERLHADQELGRRRLRAGNAHAGAMLATTDIVASIILAVIVTPAWSL